MSNHGGVGPLTEQACGGITEERALPFAAPCLFRQPGDVAGDAFGHVYLQPGGGSGPKSVLSHYSALVEFCACGLLAGVYPRPSASH